MSKLTMFELQGWLKSLGPAALLFRADGAPTIDDLQVKLLDLTQDAEAIQDNADREDRDLSDEEKDSLKQIFADFDETEMELDRRKKIGDQQARLNKHLGRKTEPDDAPPIEEAPVSAGQRPSARLPAEPRQDQGRWGWQSLGHFASAVRSASMPGNASQMDPRLVRGAPTTFGTEGVGEDGGFAVPPEFRTAISQKVFAEDSLIGRTDQLQSGSNTFTFPKDETTPWQSSGGIQAFWEGEGNQFTQSKPNLNQDSVRLNKLTALVPVTSELLEDAPAMDSYLRRKAPEKLDYKVSDAIIRGTGSGMPRGVLNSSALITVSKESGQAADTIVFANVNKMYSRMYARWRMNGVWVINQDIEPQLNSLNHPGDSSPVFMPAGGISQAPFGTIFGRPILPHEAADTLGNAGDIMFIDFNQYLTVSKVGGIRAETSMHLWFDYDMMAFRFILRLAGQPWWDTVIARANGTNTLSWAVTLAERA